MKNRKTLHHVWGVQRLGIWIPFKTEALARLNLIEIKKDCPEAFLYCKAMKDASLVRRGSIEI